MADKHGGAGHGDATAAQGEGAGLASLRRITLRALVIAVVLFVYFVLADRSTPFTPDARVQAFILRVAPEVGGQVARVSVRDNAVVQAGDELFAIDPTPFRIAVERAQARLDRAGQSVGASTASVDVAQARLDEARATAENVRAQTARVLELVERGIYPRAREDEAIAAIDEAAAAVSSAEADLRRAREELGPEGRDNPQIQEALAELEDARYALSRTAMTAPSLGAVSNLQLAVGQTVVAGHPAMTFISAEDVWLLGALRENSLGVIEAGQRAEVVLDAFPGRVFDATVRSVGWGVGGQSVDASTGLPKSTGESGWLTDPQRFPVILEFDPETRPRGVRYGSRAAVIVYASGNPVMAAIAWARIRLIALLTYVS